MSSAFVSALCKILYLVVYVSANVRLYLLNSLNQRTQWFIYCFQSFLFVGRKLDLALVVLIKAKQFSLRFFLALHCIVKHWILR